MVKRTLCTPCAHLLIFILTFIVILFFSYLYHLVLTTVPGSPQGGYQSLFWLSFRSSLLLSLPVSLFATLFYVRRPPCHRFFAGLILLVSAALLYTGLFVAMDRFTPAGETDPPGPSGRMFIENRFHRMSEQVIYPLHVEGEQIRALSLHLERRPRFASAVDLHIQPNPETGLIELYDDRGLRRFQSASKNLHVEPYVGMAVAFRAVKEGLGAYYREVYNAGAMGTVRLLMLLAAQIWFCVQSWVILRLSRWPLLNVMASFLLFWGFLLLHQFAESALLSDLLADLPFHPPADLLCILLLLTASLPLFVFNIISSPKAAGHD